MYQLHSQSLISDKQEIKHFLSYAIDSIVKKEVNPNSTFIISYKTDNKSTLHQHCMELIKSLDVFVKSDIELLIEKANDTSSIFLTNDVIGSRRILNNSYKQSLIWKQTICTLSKPIFIQNYNYCLFAYDISGGGGETIIFKKKNAKWTVYKRLCAWYE